MAARSSQTKTIPQTFSDTALPSFRPNRSPKKTILVALVILILAGVAYYFFTKYHELKTDPDAAAREETAALVSEVGEILVLPEEEVPTIATVSDPARLAEQPFFRNAKKGDKVLIYSQAGRVILYDPVAHKVIDIAPITSGEKEAE